MATVTSLIGKSGSGKSRSFKSLLKDDGTFLDEVFVIRMGNKPFPFKNRTKMWNPDTKTGDYIIAEDGIYIPAILEKFTIEYGKKVIIIDDSTFSMTKYFMDTANEVGYDKFSNNAVIYYNILKSSEKLAEDVRVYIVNHTDEDANGALKVKTIGKMLDEKIDIPSLLTIMLQAGKYDDGYKFLTNQRTSRDIAKSPEEMFPEMIENDLLLVDNTICDYYGYEKLKGQK